MPKRKPFIDKKKDKLHTFRLVPRSQRDPLVADESAPQNVLAPVEEEQHKKYGIYFDDNYDYLQHLRDVKEAVNWEDGEDGEVYYIPKVDPQAHKKDLRAGLLVMPSSAFESHVEESIGLLNKAAPVTGPQPDLDPDIVEALDDDYLYFEDDMPDDFISALIGMVPTTEEDGVFDYVATINEDDEHDFSSDFNDSDEEDEARDTLGSLGKRLQPYDGDEDGEGGMTFRDEETKSHFTEYSLSSSVVRRTELLSTLDQQFEEKFMREYDDDQVGALDGEEVSGYVDENSPLYQQAMKEMNAKKAADGKTEEGDWVKKWVKDQHKQRKGNHNVEELVMAEEDEEEKWDCESFLSTYSTLYNHPKIIKEPRKAIRIDPRTGLPRVKKDNGISKSELAQHDSAHGVGFSSKIEDDMDAGTLLSALSLVSVRPPGETVEERRLRKKAVKELRRERRIEKKLNSLAFKEEKKKQEKNAINNRYSRKLAVV